MGFKTWFNSQSVRSQLLIGLLSMVVVIFAIAIPVTVSLTKSARNDLVSGSEDILQNSVENRMSAIVAGKIVNLVNLLNRNEEGFLRVIGDTIKYSTRPSGISLEPVESYPDNNLADLKPPVVPNDRSGGAAVSLSASSVYFVDQLPDGSNLPALFAANEQLLNDTSNIDVYCQYLFQNYTDIVAIYYGHHDNGFFRKYPGHSTKLSDPNRDYDPRQRPWYQTALGEAGDISITDPYLDAFGLGWMITISFRLNDLDGNLMGVVGVDMRIATIRENIVDFQLDDSKSYLIQANEVVLSAPEWIPSLSSGTLFTVDDITEAPIKSVWSTIVANQNGVVESQGHIMIYRSVTIGDRSYYYVTAVPKDVALDVVYQHVSSLDDDVDALIAFDVAMLLGGAAICIIWIIIAVHCITKPIRKTQKLAIDAGQAVASGEGLSGMMSEITDSLNTPVRGGEAGATEHSFAGALHTMANRSDATTMPVIPSAPVGDLEAPPGYEASQRAAASQYMKGVPGATTNESTL